LGARKRREQQSSSVTNNQNVFHGHKGSKLRQP
jgi:hypothetical protein